MTGGHLLDGEGVVDWPYLWLDPQDFASSGELRKYLKIIGLYDKHVEKWLK